MDNISLRAVAPDVRHRLVKSLNSLCASYKRRDTLWRCCNEGSTLLNKFVYAFKCFGAHSFILRYPHQRVFEPLRCNYLTVLKYILFSDLYCDTDMSVEFIEEYTFDEYGNVYLVLSDTELEFIGTVFDGEKLIIPATVGEREVVGVGWHAFDGCYAEEIILPDTVEYISSAAFWGCHNLTELTLPKNLKRLGISVFSFCEKLERLVIPHSLEFIGLPDNKQSCLPYHMFSELDPDKLTVVYEGTKEQFDAINFYNPWGDGDGDYFDYEHYEHILEFVEFN